MLSTPVETEHSIYKDIL
ncbi:rCG43325 [Rattus norvegicus]|uniref:RCG43325 n=1 Tax=Rattus norvegicus TaxID=10116 RepID=A6IVJ8_RAT|nr:rCG43325 [Rattus norvegicus]